MRFWAIPIKNLWRRPARSLFAVLGISLAVATYAAMTVLFGQITQEWKNNLIKSGVHALIIQDRQVDWLASSLPERLQQEIETLEPVYSANGELLSFLTIPDGTVVLASGWARRSSLWGQLSFLTGGPPAVNRNDHAIIGENAAAALGIKTGDTINLDGLDITISGTFKATDTLTGGRIAMPLEMLQSHMFRQGSITLIQVTLKRPEDPASINSVSAFLAENYPNLAVRLTEQLSQDNRIIELLTVLSSAVIWIVSFVAIAVTANVMLMAVNERRAEIGLLIAIGWSPTRIVSVFLLEAIILASMSGIAGICIGILIIEMLRDSATLAAFLSTSMTPAAAVRAFILAVGIGAISSILPALQAIRTPADSALRSI